MNHVERFRALMNFQPVDRLPRIEWAGWWDKTVQRWKTEGLPADMNDAFEIRKHLGLDPYRQFWWGPRRSTCPVPPGHGLGIAHNMDEYLGILPHLYWPTEAIGEQVRKSADAQSRGEEVLWITLEGFFWFPRTLLGIEPHMYAFYDQPELIHRINRDLTDFHVRLLRDLARTCRPAFMTFAEDMSYNHGPMLSKKLFDEFIGPYYRRLTPILKEMDTPVIVDSDGDVTELIPWLMEVGVDGILPLERQAGVDAALLRKRFPRFRMIGHYDKMVMTRGEQAMRDEFERLLPVTKSGGFIPSVDHQTPPGVSLGQYRVYLRLLEEYAPKVRT